MMNVFRIIRENKLYAGFAVFILLINLLVLAEKYLPEPPERPDKVVTEEVVEEKAVEEKAVEEEERKLFDEEDVQARQEKIEKLATENPLFYIFLGLVNMAILFIAFVGLLFNVYFLVRFFKKEPLDIRVIGPERPRWTLGDVVRVTLIFLTFGYLFVIFQASVVKYFPLLNNDNFRMIFNTAMMNVVGISVILYFVIKKHGQKINAIGLTLKGFSKSVYYAIVGYVALVPILLGIMVITFFVTKLIKYQPPVQPIVEVFMEEKETAVLWLSTLFAAIFGPVAEEIFFRGFMYNAIKRTLGMFWGMIITAAVFSMLHAHIAGFLPIMALGILLAYLYEKTGSLVTSMSVHIMHNVGMLLMVFLMRGIGT
ncbi:lysostaphin resistance A-like protein [Candidatus Omnitrophota bacterium]